MPTRKIGDLPKPHDGWRNKPKKPCSHPEHNPPSMISLPPGIYEHKCPGCGRKTVFRVEGFYWSTVGKKRADDVFWALRP